MGLIDDLLHYIDNPLSFVEDVIGAKPTWQQREVLEEIAISNAVAAASGHGIGKTAVEAWVIIWFLVMHPFSRIPCTAPTGHQLDDILWPEIKYWLEKSDISSQIQWTKTRLSMKGFDDTWFAVPCSANKPENLQGFHGQHLFYVVDEASGMDQKIMEVVEGALTNEGAKLLMMGNPTQLVGTFHDAFHKDRELFSNFTFSSEDTKLVATGYCKRIEKKYGKTSDVYRVRVEGKFPRGDVNTRINLDEVEVAIKNEVAKGGNIYLGVDPARFGDDESVICYRWGYHVYQMVSFQGIDTVRLAGETVRLIRAIREHGYIEEIEVRVDDTGIGAGVVDQLNAVRNGLHQVRQTFDMVAGENLKFIVIPVNFGGPGDKDSVNAATVMWDQVKSLLPFLQLPNDDKMTSQLTTRQYSIAADGRVKIEDKKTMKKRGLKSPDRADALCLCLANVSAPKLGAQKSKLKPITGGLREERF